LKRARPTICRNLRCATVRIHRPNLLTPIFRSTQGPRDVDARGVVARSVLSGSQCDRAGERHHERLGSTAAPAAVAGQKDEVLRILPLLSVPAVDSCRRADSPFVNVIFVLKSPRFEGADFTWDGGIPHKIARFRACRIDPSPFGFNPSELSCRPREFPVSA
jgi:hypothetical protein